MSRGWPTRLIPALLMGLPGCVHFPPGSSPEYAAVAENVRFAARRPPETVGPDDPDGRGARPRPGPARAAGPAARSTPTSGGPWRENRTVQAARANVLAMQAAASRR